MQKEIRVATEVTFEKVFKDKNVNIVPDSATISIWNNTGSELVTDEAMTVSSEGVLTYTLADDVIEEVGKNFKGEIKAVLIGEDDLYESFLFDAVKSPIINILDDDTLFTLLPMLADTMQFSSDFSADGTVNTFIDQKNTKDDDFWKGGRVTIYTPNAAFSEVDVLSNVKATKTVTFEPDLDSATVSGTPYRIRASFQDQIDIAFDIMRRDVRNNRESLSRFIDSEEFKLPHAYKALELICLSKARGEESDFAYWHNYYAAQYEEFLKDYTDAYDADDNGNISDDEARVSTRNTDVHR